MVSHLGLLNTLSPRKNIGPCSCPRAGFRRGFPVDKKAVLAQIWDTVNVKRRLIGIDDDDVEILFDSVLFSGDACVERVDQLLRRITPARFEKTARLIEATRYFGGRVRFVHREDLDEEDLEYVWCYTPDCSPTTLGTYCHVDAWITVPVDRHKGWGSIENTLRHELIHLLQDVTDTRPRTDDRELPLLSTKMKWGDWLAQICLEEHDRQEAIAESNEDVTPLCELEAHSVDTWVKTIDDWVEEVKTRELYAGAWCCSLEE